MRLFLRWLVLTVLVGLVLAILAGVFGEFFIEWARENGWYENPSQKLDTAMKVFSEFVTQPWFLYATTFIAGLTLGVWLDWIVRRSAPDPISLIDPDIDLSELQVLVSNAKMDAEKMHDLIRWNYNLTKLKINLSKVDPYLDIYLFLINASMYQITFSAISGSFRYGGDELRGEPALVNPPVLVPHGGHNRLRIRQPLSDSAKAAMKELSAEQIARELIADHIIARYEFINIRGSRHTNEITLPSDFARRVN